jgi:hypothetical protein
MVRRRPLAGTFKPADYDCARVARARIGSGSRALDCCTSCHNFGIGVHRLFRGIEVTVCCRGEIAEPSDMNPIEEDDE